MLFLNWNLSASITCIDASQKRVQTSFSVEIALLNPKDSSVSYKTRNLKWLTDFCWQLQELSNSLLIEQ